MSRTTELMLELSALEDDVSAKLTNAATAPALAVRHTNDPATIRLAKVVSGIAKLLAMTAQRRALILDELLEAGAAEAGLVSMRPTPAKPRGRRQTAR